MTEVKNALLFFRAKFILFLLLVFVPSTNSSLAQAQDLAGEPLNEFLGKPLGNRAALEFDFRLEDDLGFGRLHSNRTLADQPWGIQVVTAADGYPVRRGDQSLRFEVREGFCDEEEDCAIRAARNLIDSYNDQDRLGRDEWYAFSVYVPDDFEPKPGTFASLFQFFAYGEPMMHIMYQSPQQQRPGLQLRLRHNDSFHELVPVDAAREKWIDILIRARHSAGEDGSVTVWVNGIKAHEYFGQTIAGTNRNRPGPYSKVGLLNFAVPESEITDGRSLSSLHAYIDEIRYGANCAALKLGDLGYDCGAFSYEDADRDDARNLQSALNTLGCDVGSVDGVIGRKTAEQAMTCRRFPEGQLPPTLSTDTLAQYAARYTQATLRDDTGQKVVVISDTLSRNIGPQNDNSLFVEAEYEYKALKMKFIMVGKFDESGATEFLHIVFEEPVSNSRAASIAGCRGADTEMWSDGSTHVVLEMVRRFGGQRWIVEDMNCLTERLPQPMAEQLEFITENFDAIAAAVAADGFKGEQIAGLTAFINKIARGELSIGDEPEQSDDAPVTITDAVLDIVGSNKDQALTIHAQSEDVQLRFLLVGKFSDEGASDWLALLFQDAITVEHAAQLTSCIGAKTQTVDGETHPDLQFLRVGRNRFVIGDADCIEAAVPADIAEELAFLRTGMQFVVAQLVETGFRGTQHTGMKRFLSAVANGDTIIEIR